jgi:vacuolar iron transporter family protein
MPSTPHLEKHINTALLGSVGVTVVALFIFGYVKGRMTGISPFRGGLQTVVIGGLASAAAFTLAKLIRPS